MILFHPFICHETGTPSRSPQFSKTPASVNGTSARQPSPAALQLAKAGGAGGSCNLTKPDYWRRAFKSGAGLLWLQLQNLLCKF